MLELSPSLLWCSGAIVKLVRGVRTSIVSPGLRGLVSTSVRMLDVRAVNVLSSQLGNSTGLSNAIQKNCLKCKNHLFLGGSACCFWVVIDWGMQSTTDSWEGSCNGHVRNT